MQHNRQQIRIMETTPILNEHNKQEPAPVDLETLDKSQAISYDQGYAIRAIATAMIIFVHSINEYECYYSNTARLLLLPVFGVLGCSLFFFMSGYGLMNSLYVSHKKPTTRYIFSHLSKILIPVAIVYILNSILLPHTLSYNNIVINHHNIFTLTLPEGTNIWFVKIILFDYITTFLLFRLTTRIEHLLFYLFITQSALIAILYICKADGFWYISNLCFVLGALHIIHPLFKTKYIIISFSLFAIFYLCIVNSIISAPIQITGCLAFCMIITYIVKKINNWPRWIKYIGKNSLLYYLLNIPIMWLIPSYNIHFITYFAANFIATTFLAFVYNIFSNSLARLSKKHLA